MANGKGFEAIGRNPDTSRVSVKVMGSDLLVRIPIAGKAANKPPLSSTGKSHLMGNTGGFADVPELDGMRINVCLTRKVGKGKGASA